MQGIFCRKETLDLDWISRLGYTPRGENIYFQVIPPINEILSYLHLSMLGLNVEQASESSSDGAKLKTNSNNNCKNYFLKICS